LLPTLFGLFPSRKEPLFIGIFGETLPINFEES
jgi:hypothetical protein